MNVLEIELDSAAIRQWLQSAEMSDMLETFARQSFGKDYEVKVMPTRAIITSDKASDKDLLRGVKGGGKRK